MRCLFSVVELFILNCVFISCVNTGFWYGETRGPLLYDSIPYVNISVKINRSFEDGPGQNLFTDPNHHTNSIYVGNTINRQSFDTQFVLDLEYALGLNPNRIYVTQVIKGDVHFSWESSSVIVYFMLLERNSTIGGITLIQAVANLTSLVQLNSSRLYVGTNVTRDIDHLYGVQVVTWDVSLKLTYSIQVVGGTSVIDGYYLNYGALGFCDTIKYAYEYAQYCEFERLFEDDISTALDIPYYRVQVQFVKSASLDAVLVFFRILPPMARTNAATVSTAIANLVSQVGDYSSMLYKGNVTLRVDPVYGVSGTFAETTRSAAALFTQQNYYFDPRRPVGAVSAYDRCKANRRCNWGVAIQNQSTNVVCYFHQLFELGELFPVQLFLDFEDWRMGSSGFNWNGDVPPTADREFISASHATPQTIAGAHFWPFVSHPIGPIVPSYGYLKNEGLVFDRANLHDQLSQQKTLVADVRGRVNWTREYQETALMDAKLRSRKDVRREMTNALGHTEHWLRNEEAELRVLQASQCSATNCVITFNTSSLLVTGAFSATGIVLNTSSGTEVAVFVFNSIYLGPEVEVRLVGQRAIALISRTTATINTTIVAQPGTIGGMRGGYSVSKLFSDTLSDQPRDVLMCALGGNCWSRNYSAQGDGVPAFTAAERRSLLSYNVNGPGSGNLQVHSFVVETRARYLPEIQVVRVTAQPGQTVEGGFTLKYKSFLSSVIPCDASASQLKEILETDLNLEQPAGYPVSPSRYGRGAGVGLLNVTRSVVENDEVGGYTWAITFTTATGNVPQLQPTSYLKALRADVSVTTLRQGNEVGGYFTLHYKDFITAPIYAQDSAEIVRQKILALPAVSTVYVDRTDPTANCDDGLCFDGALPSTGMLWTIYATVDSILGGNPSPASPAAAFGLRGLTVPVFTIDASHILGTNASAVLRRGWSRSPDDMQSLLTVEVPFSLAYGGAGGSYGGVGGVGYSDNPVGTPYGSSQIPDLVGGSGGCLRGRTPFETNAFLGLVRGRGGHGGGAIEIVAAGDITVGSFGVLSVNGGDAEQTSDGGGGGGSGGTILLAAGGVVTVDGTLEAAGGDGGYGGTNLVTTAGGSVSPAGGGGGGGRIAMYGQSVSIREPEAIVVRGGRCGVFKSTKAVPALILNISVSVDTRGYLDPVRLSHLVRLMLNMTLSPLAIFPNGSSGYTHGFAVALPQNSLSNNYYALSLILEPLVGLMVANVEIVGASLLSYESRTLSLPSAESFGCANTGEDGSLYTEAEMTTSMYVSNAGGAEGSKRSLYLKNNEVTNTSTGSPVEVPFAWNGPLLPFPPAQPTRVTYYVKVNPFPQESYKSGYGTLFTLLSRGASDLNVTSVIGVYVGEQIKFGNNFESAVDEVNYLQRLGVLDPYPAIDQWYKVDIRIQWNLTSTYSILLNDVLVTKNNVFRADKIDGIRLSTFFAIEVNYDEIYVGFDNAMGFQCPISTRRGPEVNVPLQRGWSASEVYTDEVFGYDQLYPMQRHYNFLDPQNAVKFDGQGLVKSFDDLNFKFPQGDYPIKAGKLHAGALQYLSQGLRTAHTPNVKSATTVTPPGLWTFGSGDRGDGRYFWYIEHSFAFPNTNASYGYNIGRYLDGGVASCSSQDMLTWRFEGIVTAYYNLSDMVFGSAGPFSLERPAVIQNQNTSNYVMFASMNEPAHTLGQSATFTSPFSDGPFILRRTSYPDGNRTRDQVAFINEGGAGVLGRTYYATVEYLMPEAVMQPVWESVKFPNGSVHFSLNYHRAFYNIGYDNFHDIYLQRWRHEDQPWTVYCVDVITGARRNVPYDQTNAEGAVCDNPDEYKLVVGQGHPAVTTRFLSPNSTDNSWWMQTSVPSVKAQPWANDYMDGLCGVRKLDDDHDILDPELESFVPSDNAKCSNIDDNPTHPTLQDKLLGVMKIRTKRRAKYIAVSLMTPDYLDLSGVVQSTEGELDSGNLITIITRMGQFGLGPGTSIGSTFPAPVRSEFKTAVDFKYRFRQFIDNYNDRSEYALACVIDGVCPVNYKDQLYM